MSARIAEAAERVAAFLGGRGEDWAFVENATAGLNAIIASLAPALTPGDEILCLSQVYGAIGNALRYHAERTGARVVTVEVPVPFVDPAPLLAALAAAIGPRTRLAVFDHITSAGAVVLPIREMAALCRERGVPVAIDGAHAPGQIALDVPALGVDWYVGNLHKWAFAAKGTGVIWCAPERQPALHPTAISHALGAGLYRRVRLHRHARQLGLARRAGGARLSRGPRPEAVRAHNAALAREAGAMLVEAWDSEAAAAPEFCAAMVSVRLPGGARRRSRCGAPPGRAAERTARHHRRGHGAGRRAMDPRLGADLQRDRRLPAPCRDRQDARSDRFGSDAGLAGQQQSERQRQQHQVTSTASTRSARLHFFQSATKSRIDPFPAALSPRRAHCSTGQLANSWLTGNRRP